VFEKLPGFLLLGKQASRVRSERLRAGDKLKLY
jgi:hypothetical protein